jgi:hypothetical protein
MGFNSGFEGLNLCCVDEISAIYLVINTMGWLPLKTTISKN